MINSNIKSGIITIHWSNKTSKAQSGVVKRGTLFQQGWGECVGFLVSVCVCVCVCERMRACVSGCVCGYAQLRINAVARSMERWGKWEEGYAQAHRWGMLCARSQSCLRIVTGCGCGSGTGNFSLLRRNFSWGEVHEYGMPRTKDFALRTNPGWALIQILRSSTTLRLQCVRVYVRVVMQKGVREREKEIER